MLVVHRSKIGSREDLKLETMFTSTIRRREHKGCLSTFVLRINLGARIQQRLFIVSRLLELAAAINAVLPLSSFKLTFAPPLIRIPDQVAGRVFVQHHQDCFTCRVFRVHSSSSGK